MSNRVGELKCRDDAVDSFMLNANQYPRISVQEEFLLAKRIASGDKEAFDILVNSNLRLVVKIAHGFLNLGVSFGDLVGAGSVGLIKAAEKFNPVKGAKFSSYASWWIKAMMKKEIANMSHSITISPSSYRKMKKVQAIKESLGEGCTPEQIAKKMGGGSKAYYIKEIMDGLSQTSLNQMILDGDVEMIEKVASENFTSPIDKISMEEQIGIMSNAFHQVLNSDEQLVISMRFGFNENRQTYTLASIASVMRISYQRVAQIEDNALSKMRDMMKNEK